MEKRKNERRSHEAERKDAGGRALGRGHPAVDLPILKEELRP